MKHCVGLAAALLLAASGCGGDGAESSEQGISASTSTADPSDDELTAAEKKVALRIEAQLAGSEYIATGKPQEAACLAKGMVGAFGTEKLQSLGVLTPDLDLAAEPRFPMAAADAEAWADLELSCVDYQTHVKLLVDAWNDPPLPAAKMSDCVDAVTEEDIHALISGFWQDDPKDHTFEKLRVAGCGEFSGG